METAAGQIKLIIALLLSIKSILGDKSPFTREVHVLSGGKPILLKGQIAFHNGEDLRSSEAGGEICNPAPFDVYTWPKSIVTLGNGKILTTGMYLQEYKVVDYKNCSLYSTTSLKNSHNYEVAHTAVIPYYDSFDVFSLHQDVCMPCRFNDKGESLQVEYSLQRETEVYGHRGDPAFSMDFIEDAFDVKNGYLYLFNYHNNTSAVRILDSKFKIVKEQFFDFAIAAHSLTQRNLTICRKGNSCGDDKICQYVECHFLDQDLNSIVKTKLYQHRTEYQDQFDVWLKIRNLNGGGAMAAMNFEPNVGYLNQTVFIQRIHPNGRIDSPIEFERSDSPGYSMYDYTFDNGEYCLVSGAHFKCLVPSPADYSKL